MWAIIKILISFAFTIFCFSHITFGEIPFYLSFLAGAGWLNVFIYSISEYIMKKRFEEAQCIILQEIQKIERQERVKSLYPEKEESK